MGENKKSFIAKENGINKEFEMLIKESDCSRFDSQVVELKALGYEQYYRSIFKYTDGKLFRLGGRFEKRYTIESTGEFFLLHNISLTEVEEV